MFTAHRYEDFPEYREKLLAIPNLNYIVFGHEVAPVTGAKHLQGYLELKIRTKLSTLKNLYCKEPIHGFFRAIHYEAAKHYRTWAECRAYCVKEGGEVVEWGVGEYDKVGYWF
jgi:hypothetical protein